MAVLKCALITGYVFLYAVVGTKADCCSDDALRFLVLADWGGQADPPYSTCIESRVAGQMSMVADQYNTSFIVALGDNFYEKGVKDVDDPRFKYTFEDVYVQPSLMTPWYLVAGNHDHDGNVSAQIAYSQKSDRWNFPAYYYRLSFRVPGGKQLDILMLDTVMLCGNSGPDDLNLQPGGLVNDILANKQWTWIELQLKASKADYLLVGGHFPVYSIAEHGPTKCLTDRLKPMLYKYNVTAYLSGHDHNLQHISVPENQVNMEYFVIGAADKIDTSTEHKADIPKHTLRYHWAEDEVGGFAYLAADDDDLTLTFVDGLGQELYKFAMFPRTVA